MGQHELVAEQLGRGFHLCALIQRSRASQMLLLFVRAELIPADGVAGLKPASAAVNFGPEHSAALASGTAVQECWGLVVGVELFGSSLCFAACRLDQGDSPQSHARRMAAVRMGAKKGDTHARCAQDL